MNSSPAAIRAQTVVAALLAFTPGALGAQQRGYSVADLQGAYQRGRSG